MHLLRTASLRPVPSARLPQALHISPAHPPPQAHQFFLLGVDRRPRPGLRDIEDDGETRELGMKKGASARSWGNLEDPNRTALIKTESFGTSEKYMSARI